jgi:hypothetical protein
MLDLTWQPEPNPAPAQMVLGLGPAALTLAQRIRAPEPALADSVQVLLGQTFLALKASPDQLPWVDGLAYLRPARVRSRLYLPTHLRANLPSPWLEAYFLEAYCCPLHSPSHSRYDILYWPPTNQVIQADRYWPLGILKQDQLLDIWHDHYSPTLASLDD